GTETVLPGRILKVEEGLATVELGTVQLLALAPDIATTDVHVCIRGEEVALQQGITDHASPRNRLPGVVCALMREGPMVRVQLDCGFPLTALVTRPSCDELGLIEGSPVTAVLKVPAIHLIPRG